MSLGDPSYGIHRDLLPHVHLISTYRHPMKARVEPVEVTGWLMQAPKIARDTAPFFWTYLERPENGNIFLTWQPLQQMGVNFASDGYVWPPQEQYLQQEVGNGVVLEMYYHKAGFAIGEPLALHSRRRFRLIPPSVHTPNAPQVDPGLWIVHYGPIENNERIPQQVIPRDPRSNSIMETRAYLQRCGQIQRKEFILSDRPNWPQIGWPREASRPQPMFAPQRGVPQAMAYPPHPPTAGGPPSKRARTGQAAQGQVPPTMAAIPPPDSAYDDEEDTSRGDMFDHLTPREVSLARYRQNHEWMEEILSSPYRMGQIGFSDLGLGLKGELSSLTEGIFEAYSYESAEEVPSKTTTTKIDPDQAAEFRKRVNDRLSSTQAEIEKMKADHAKKLAKFKQNSLLTTTERELRLALDEPGVDALQLEGKVEESEDGANRWPSRHNKKVDDIVSQVEAHLGRRAEVIYELRRIQDGGYQEPALEPAPQPALGPGSTTGGPQTGSANGSAAMSRQPSHTGSQNSAFMMDSDIDMGGTAAGLLDQMHTGTGASSTGTPVNNFPTPQGQPSAVHSSVATPAGLNIPSPRQPPQRDETGDVKMDGTSAAEPPAATAPDQGTGSGDWVVVPKGGAVPDGPPNPTSDNNPPKPADTLSKQASATGTPSAGFEGDQNDFSSLEDLNTAGDALAGFDGTPGDLGEGLDLEMEDSAFGDAFHGVDTQQGGTPAEGNM
ncbi:DUF1750-domain-containing protein [Hypoxylon trugodes]|uniref:DUF1750-domain-containing protein n=1 Tax=Hypoxylon trugodes TaxID=326681 RepID=UPI00219C891A|nr:DUF1750-domain-containing protein [Hypoxylon trugodes]KAI1386578.1 DUF1750-domain-containing protein [Hypoxylon trugodes]